MQHKWLAALVVAVFFLTITAGSRNSYGQDSRSYSDRANAFLGAVQAAGALGTSTDQVRDLAGRSQDLYDEMKRGGWPGAEDFKRTVVDPLNNLAKVADTLEGCGRTDFAQFVTPTLLGQICKSDNTWGTVTQVSDAIRNAGYVLGASNNNVTEFHNRLIKQTREEIITMYIIVYSQFSGEIPADARNILKQVYGHKFSGRALDRKVDEVLRQNPGLAQKLEEAARQQPGSNADRERARRGVFTQVNGVADRIFHLSRDVNNLEQRNNALQFVLDGSWARISPHTPDQAPAVKLYVDSLNRFNTATSTVQGQDEWIRRRIGQMPTNQSQPRYVIIPAGNGQPAQVVMQYPNGHRQDVDRQIFLTPDLPPEFYQALPENDVLGFAHERWVNRSRQTQPWGIITLPNQRGTNLPLAVGPFDQLDLRKIIDPTYRHPFFLPQLDLPPRPPPQPGTQPGYGLYELATDGVRIRGQEGRAPNLAYVGLSPIEAAQRDLTTQLGLTRAQQAEFFRYLSQVRGGQGAASPEDVINWVRFALRNTPVTTPSGSQSLTVYLPGQLERQTRILTDNRRILTDANVPAPWAEQVQAPDVIRYGVSGGFSEQWQMEQLSDFYEATKKMLDVAEEMADEDPRDSVKSALKHNPAMVAKTLVNNPGYAQMVCELLQEIEDDKSSQQFWDTFWIVTGIVAAVAIIVLTAGAGIGVVAASTAFIASTVVTGVATGGSIIYNTSRGFDLQEEARQAERHIAFGVDNAAEVRRLRDQATEHFTTAIIDGVLLPLDAFAFFKGLRAMKQAKALSALQQAANGGDDLIEAVAETRRVVQGTVRAGVGIAEEVVEDSPKFFARHLEGTPSFASLMRKEGAAHVFTDEATMKRVAAEIFERGDELGEIRGAKRWGLRFDEPIGYRIDRAGNKIPLHYGEVKIRNGKWHVIPRTGPAG